MSFIRSPSGSAVLGFAEGAVTARNADQRLQPRL